jgi:hypothetical protein
LEQSADRHPGSHQHSEGHWIDVRIAFSINHSQIKTAGRSRNTAATRTQLTVLLQACTKGKVFNIWPYSSSVSSRCFVLNEFFRNFFVSKFMFAVIFIYLFIIQFQEGPVNIKIKGISIGEFLSPLLNKHRYGRCI